MDEKQIDTVTASGETVSEIVYEEHEPEDIDVVSFVVHHITGKNLKQILLEYKLFTFYGSQSVYFCDSYMVDMSNVANYESLVEQVAYWYSVFSHTRTKIWKGMLWIPLPESSEEYESCLEMIERRQNHEHTC